MFFTGNGALPVGSKVFPVKNETFPGRNAAFGVKEGAKAQRGRGAKGR